MYLRVLAGLYAYPEKKRHSKLSTIAKVEDRDAADLCFENEFLVRE